MTVVEALLKLRPDQRSIGDSIKAIGSVESRLEQVSKGAEAIGKAASIAGRSLKDMAAQTNVNPATQELATLRSELVSVQNEAVKTSAALQDIKKPDVSGSVGDISTSLGAAGSVASLAGGGALQGALQGGGDIAGLIEYLPRFGEGIQAIGTAVNTATGPLSSMASSALSAVPGLSSAGAGLVTMGVVGAAAGAAIAFAAVALGDYNKGVNEQVKAVQSATAGRRSVNEQLASGTLSTEVAQAEIERLSALVTSEQGELARAQEARRRFNEGFGAAAGIVAIFDKREQLIVNQRNEAQDNIDDYRGSITALQAAMDNGSTTAIDRAQAEEAATDADKRGIAASEGAKQNENELSQERARSAQVIAQLTEQEASIRAAASQQSAQTREDRKIRDRRADEDQKELAIAANARLKAIRADGFKQIEAITKEAGKAEVQATAKARKDIIAAEAKINKDRAKLEVDSQKATLKRDVDFSKERQRAAKALDQQIFEGELSNDILSITVAKRRGETEASQRQQDFDATKQEAATQKEERLAEIRAEGEARIAEIKSGLGEERAQIQAGLVERLTAQRTQNAAAVAGEQAQQATQEASRQKRNTRQAEDDALADRRRQEATNRQLQEITRKRDAELQGIQAVQTAALTMVRSVQQAAASRTTTTTQRPTNNSSNTRPTSGGGASGGGGSFIQFGKGGLVPKGKEVFAQFEGNRNYDEVVLPLNADTLSRLALSMNTGQGGGFTMNGDIVIGAGNQVTVDDVRGALKSTVREILKANQAALSGAR